MFQNNVCYQIGRNNSYSMNEFCNNIGVPGI